MTKLGQTLGRYRLDSLLGRGGMAEVYLAVDTQLGRQVALKVILGELAADAQLVDRFLREAQLVASLEHPHILPIYDLGEHEGAPFLVMPYLRGGSLADHLRRERIPYEKAVAWLAQIASALDAAHLAGVLHRDIKPSNVLIGRDDRLFLADFGIARLARETSRLTRTGTIIGTPVYMAPEVIAGGDAAASADRYSLAVMAYEMLSGTPPFFGENVLSVLHQHANEAVPSIHARRAELPPELDHVLERGLAKAPGDRPTTCMELAEAISIPLPPATRAALLSAAGTATLPSVAVPDALTATLESSRAFAMVSADAPTVRSHPPLVNAASKPTSPTHRRAWLIAGIAATLVLGVLLALAFSGDREAERSVEESSFEVFEQSAPPMSPPPPLAETPLAETPPVASVPPPIESPPSDPTTSKPSMNEPSARASRTVDDPLRRRLFAGRDPASLRTPRDGVFALLPWLRDPLVQELFRSDDFEKVRGGRQRIQPALFDDLLAMAAEAGAKDPSSEPAALFATWAGGGRAWLAGDVESAAERLELALSDERFGLLWGLGAFSLIERAGRPEGFLEPWEIALAYGDAAGTARGLVTAELAESPDDPALRLARALVHRLDGEHGAVIEIAEPLYGELAATEGDALAALAALLVAESHGARKQVDDTLRWLHRAVDAGGPHAGMLAFRAGIHAQQAGQPKAAEGFLRGACRTGVPMACAAQRRIGR